MHLSKLEIGKIKLSRLKNLTTITNQYIKNEGGFRRYVNEQSYLSILPFLVRSAQQLVPSIKSQDIIISKKVGIRAQLFNNKENCLENDFILLQDNSSTHILNAISPAFTASFTFADLIIDRIFSKKK